MPPTQPVQKQSEPRPAGDGTLRVVNASEVAKRSQGAQRTRRRLTLASFVLLVLVPFAAVCTYFIAFAADRYAVETKFAVRTPGGSAPTDLLSMVSGVSASTSTVSDSYMVVEFIQSRDLIDRLDERLDLRAIYDTPLADPLMRLDAQSSKEDLVSYLQRVVSVYFDTSSQILTLEVQAFTPEDAMRVSQAILEISGDLVNEVSERARADTMRSAEREVARIEAQLADHRRALNAFRQTEQDIDPTASAVTQIQLLGELEARLAEMRTRLESMLGFLDADAPSIRILRGQIAALERQLETQRARLGDGLPPASEAERAEGVERPSLSPTMAARVGVYEDLAIDLEFLQQAYVTALAAREAARIEADRAQRYLAVFVRPSLPEDALYPQRELSILLFAAFALMLWAIGVMIVYIIREHRT